MRPPDNAQYIGDGVYVSFDGYQHWIWAQRELDWHYIALEPPVAERLFKLILSGHMTATGDTPDMEPLT